MATIDGESFHSGTATLDQVIAYNVRRLRQERGWTRRYLAEEMEVGRSLVYDFEGARKDRQQREFKWSELVTLCAVFQTTLWDLVLPPEGVRVLTEFWPSVEVDDIALALRRDMPDSTPDRRRLSELLFGVAMSAEHLATLVASAEKRREARLEALAEALMALARIDQEEEAEHGND